MIPRQESELFFSILDKKKYKYGLDIGTGSGNLAITLSLEKICSKITALDISKRAIEVAKKNIKKFKIKNIKLIKKNVFNYTPTNKFDLIISNPPYVSIAAYNELPLEIKLYEPKIALTDDKKGLSFYDYYSVLAEKILLENGTMLIALGKCHKPKQIQDLFESKGFKTHIYFDYQQDPRIIQVEHAD